MKSIFPLPSALPDRRSTSEDHEEMARNEFVMLERTETGDGHEPGQVLGCIAGRFHGRARFIQRRQPTRRSLLLSGLAVAALSCGGVSPTRPSEAAAQLAEYRDPGGRFSFSYPQSFGAASTGTDNGFGNRVAAIRFEVFSNEGVGGEAVLGQGPVSVDVLAVGGLYDDIASGTLPAAMKSAVASVLPRLTLANFCDQVARERHIDINDAAFASLTADQRAALAALDLMGNAAPRVLACFVNGDTVVFDKEAAVMPGGPPRRVYGAIRFLSGRNSMFEVVRAAGKADQTLLDDLSRVVSSLRVL
jgi:hypothetical protein